jgi:hypothetical protein
MTTENLNGYRLQFAFNAWGVSHYGEPSFCLIDVENSIPKISQVILNPERTLIEDISPKDLTRFIWSENIHDQEGVFYISKIGEDDVLLMCTLTEGEWCIDDYDESLSFLTKDEFTLSDEVVQLLRSIFTKAIESFK